MKTLIFEGAGWAGADTSEGTDVSNCRIRTRLRNNIGRVIYLELGCCQYSGKFQPEFAKGFNYCSHIDSVFYTDSKWDNNRNYSRSLSHLQDIHFEYNKANILKFVNKNLNCSFDDIVILNEGLSVHDTDAPLCDCSNGNYISYKDIDYNINQLDGIKPKYQYKNYNNAEYRISYDSVIKFEYIQKYVNNQMERDRQAFKNLDFYASINWDNNGNIYRLEISANKNFCNMGMSLEDVQKVIDLIIKDNKEEAKTA